jgi:hypothetical protein
MRADSGELQEARDEPRSPERDQVETLPRVRRHASATRVAAISAPTIFHEHRWREATSGARFREVIAYDTSGAMIERLRRWNIS